MTGSGVTLYHGLASTCSKKVRLALYEKGVPFESRLLDLQKFEQHEPAFLAINPNGVVPAMVHNGHSIVESSVIAQYVDDTFPGLSLTPADTFDRAEMRLWLKYSDDVAYKAVYIPTWQFMRTRAEEGLKSEKREETLARMPAGERRERWAKMAEGGFSEAEIADAYEKMSALLAKIDGAVAKTGWLAGSDYSLADIANIPFVDRINNLKPGIVAGGDYPNLADWYARLRARPAFAKAFDFRDDPRAAELPNI